MESVAPDRVRVIVATVLGPRTRLNAPKPSNIGAPSARMARVTLVTNRPREPSRMLNVAKSRSRACKSNYVIGNSGIGSWGVTYCSSARGSGAESMTALT